MIDKIASHLSKDAHIEAQNFVSHMYSVIHAGIAKSMPYVPSTEIDPLTGEDLGSLYAFRTHINGQSNKRYSKGTRCPNIGTPLKHPEDFGLDPEKTWVLIAYVKGTAQNSGRGHTNINNLLFMESTEP